MAVTNGMFIFEVVVESVHSYVDSRLLVIRSDFANIFSLELKDPKQMHIVMPEPLPPPPEPPGKKGKKKPKPKPKKGKKGKKGMVEEAPKEPAIQSGQSVLFTCSAELLIQNMKNSSLEVSLWSKEDNFVYIGSGIIPWDPVFIIFLENIAGGETPLPVTLKDDYNIFQEGTAKLMAKLNMQVKLSYLGEKVTSAFRTLSEDPVIKKVLYTGVNDKNSSYICTIKTTDENFEENCNKIENSFIVDKPKGNIVYADYKNAPGANLTFFNDDEFCCMGHADKPPDSIYKSPETCPDINFIIDYVRKIIVSCNDNMRMLTPRPTITPRIKATDIDRLCYCKETAWPKGKLAELYKKETQSGPCAMCIESEKKIENDSAGTFDIANIRGPCGKPNCRIARDIRAYIENLVEEDNRTFDINEIIGPCGSKSCTLAEKIQEFLRHEGVFSEGATLDGLSTQCACVHTMQTALAKKTSCAAICSKDCKDTGSDVTICEGSECPFRKKYERVYNVFYFTVEYDMDKDTPGSSSRDDKSRSSSPHEDKSKGPSSKTSSIRCGKSATSSQHDPEFQYCGKECPNLVLKSLEKKITCSKSVCSNLDYLKGYESDKSNSKCETPACPSKHQFPPSPADSHVMINFEDIHSPCCVKTCDVAERVKDFISDAVISKKNITEQDCYCDCVCNFKFSKHTTYCPVCGGYECLGDDMKDQPVYNKPHPCPVYHKLYDRKYIVTQNIGPEQPSKKPPPTSDATSMKNAKMTRSGSKTLQGADVKKVTNAGRSAKGNGSNNEKKQEETKAKPASPKLKKVGKYTANVSNKPETQKVEKKIEKCYAYPSVPKYMGWNWTADDIPGLKPRPNWKPGAANKILVRRYRAMREGLDVIAKKKRAMLQKRKKVENKPTLVITKEDGEYTVQMEVFKKYSKERLIFQYPYEDKPPLVYTVGKTAEEKRKILNQRDRRERRETRRKSRMLQSTFRDKCQEICLKAYNQAIGILPLPNPNNPECPCSTAKDQELPPPVDSCSCSEEGTIETSDTDNDEWTIEFSPPAARFDPKAKHPPVLTCNESQYTYLDYKVKVLDRSGNPVPRYFKGPDGKQECSDLGGFWSPEHIWLEINKDGFIGPDNRWAPMSFIGPDGMLYSAEDGNFTDNTGQELTIGVDGYISKEGKWVWYPRRKLDIRNLKIPTASSASKISKGGKTELIAKDKTHAKGTATGKGDRKVAMQSVGKGYKEIKPALHATSRKGNNAVVMSVNTSVNYERNGMTRLPFAERLKTDAQKIAKYKEIMQGLQTYEDFYDLRPLIKTNRATQNTIRKRPPISVIQRNMIHVRSVESCFESSTTTTFHSSEKKIIL